ncbi:MAG: hypothetical protein ACLTGU_21485 [Escherichia coli]
MRYSWRSIRNQVQRRWRAFSVENMSICPTYSLNQTLSLPLTTGKLPSVETEAAFDSDEKLVCDQYRSYIVDSPEALKNRKFNFVGKLDMWNERDLN